MTTPVDSRDMTALARTAREEMPPETQFRAEDEAVIAAHGEFLLGLEHDLVQGFYETVYAHPNTAGVFADGERPARERTLSEWWRRTVEGPKDDDYFAWMAMVGLVHVVRGVSNPMMIAMSQYLDRGVEDAAVGALPAEEAQRLTGAVRRLTATISAVVIHSYDLAIEHALYEVAGMPPALLHRLRDQEVSTSLQHARDALGRQRFE
ncbi:protoglobin domain-containing protein [Gulosibacter sp. 10]|uniref:protoglobin domain-containing protein n=1 Tax=Gulosibacter sp. 10 TaxID=1255570 RepID=UPI001C3CC788|nr:protoglobin domain-containing protein [Gulosibacter sp. 10]